MHHENFIIDCITSKLRWLVSSKSWDLAIPATHRSTLWDGSCKTLAFCLTPLCLPLLHFTSFNVPDNFTHRASLKLLKRRYKREKNTWLSDASRDIWISNSRKFLHEIIPIRAERIWFSITISRYRGTNVSARHGNARLVMTRHTFATLSFVRCVFLRIDSQPVYSTSSA